MAAEQPIKVALADNGDPILDQFGEEGFVDCTFRIMNLVSSEREYRFRLASSYEGELVGFDVVVVKGIRGALDSNFDLISDHVYYDGVQFLRSGSESDRLITVLGARYGLPAQDRQMVNSFSFTGLALHHDDIDMESEPITIKLFGNDDEDMAEDDYFESFFKLDLPSGLVFWNEKDPDFRETLIRGLSSADSAT